MILLVTYDVRRRGGIERLSLQVRDALERSGHPCRLLATRRLGPTRAGRLAGQLWFLLQLAWWLPRSELVFSMHALLLPPIRALAALPGLGPARQPLLCWLHGIEVWGANLPPLLPHLRACAGLAASSAFSRQEVLAQLGGQPPIAVIHPCADLPGLPPLPPPPRLRLLTVARMASQERYKGHDLILAALALLRQSGELDPALRWRVVGDGDDRPRLQRRAAELGLADRIDWLGALADRALAEEYRACSLLLMPSAYTLLPDGTPQGEGFGITYLEAALAGRASIAADQGGQTDLILDGQTGWLTPPDAGALAQVLRRVQADPELPRRCGERARQRAEGLFSPERQRQRLASLVEPWLGGGTRPAADPPALNSRN
ncbi:MAG: glycosyltransferase family 4 protein [Cyanobacteriota bacterium]|nr:glycosyltransferase family 4 protein [Cyanobacteriota bacterium]